MGDPRQNQLGRLSERSARDVHEVAVAQSSRRGFTLVEVLVVIAIIGMLVGLLLPAVQRAREAARRSSCLNNFKQLGLGLHNFESARRVFPTGADSKPNPASAVHAHTFYRWSALAHLTPYLDQANLRSGLDLNQPLFGMDFQVTPVNRASVAQTVPIFLCPSDLGAPVANNYGPTNYAVCAGSGAGGGTPFETDGPFYINSQTAPADVRDGLSNTAFAAESLLGTEDENLVDRGRADAQTVRSVTPR